MPALRELQADFARALRGRAVGATLAGLIVPDGLAVAERLEVYRHTARSVAVEALRLDFPATAALVGEAFFGMAAARFWRAHPPREAWLAIWGARFPAFLGRLHAARGVPYLADVARLEWALCAAARAPDAAPLDPATLTAVPAEAQAALRFTPHPSVRLLRLRYPADRIADAVLAEDDAAMAAIDLADGPVHLLVHRGPAGVTAERVPPGAWRFLRRLFAGEPLGVVLRRARGLDAAALLAAQFASHRLIAATAEERGS